MSTATDVVRQVISLRTFLTAEPTTPGGLDPVEFGVRRISAQMALDGIDNAMINQVAPMLVAAFTDDRPDHLPVNYFVGRELVEQIQAIADALPDDTPMIIPPSSRGFATLPGAVEWTDQYGHQRRFNAVSWGQMKLHYSADRPEDYPAAETGTVVGLWTNDATTEAWTFDRERIADEPKHIAFLWVHQATRKAPLWGWHLTRAALAMPGWEVGAPLVRAQETDEEQAAPVVHDTVPNMNRWVYSLFATLAGATHQPGTTRDPLPAAVELPNRTRTKLARRGGVSPLVSMVYAGAQRPPTVRENVGTRGPIGVRYWRAPYTRRRVATDGTVRVETVRGAWCGDPDAPLSPYTKVRIAKGTVARPADVIREEAS